MTKGTAPSVVKLLYFKLSGDALKLKGALPQIKWSVQSGALYTPWNNLAPVFIRAAKLSDKVTPKVWAHTRLDHPSHALCVEWLQLGLGRCKEPSELNHSPYPVHTTVGTCSFSC